MISKAIPRATPDFFTHSYPVARARVLGHLAANQMGNLVVLTGDIHSSWGNEIAGNPFVPGYAAQGVEFVCPAVTSQGIDDRAQAQRYHVRTIAERTRDQELGRVLFTASGESRLQAGTASAAATGAPSAP